MTLSKNQVVKTTSALLALVGLLHLIRTVLQWNVTINTFAIPQWVSWILAPLAGYLSYRIWNLD